jgi:hypothetical protein
MPEITLDEKVAFLKHLFPKKAYTFGELAEFFHCSKSNIKYWVAIYEVPTMRVTGSPVIIQGNLFNMLLRADKKHRNEELLTGLDFVLDDLKKMSDGGKIKK